MKICFLGCVEVGYKTLEGILEAGFSIDILISIDPSKARSTSGYCDFKPLAEKSNALYLEVRDINTPEVREKLTQLRPDLLIVCGWQRLLKKEILEIPRLGTVGFHASYLPHYRGRAPVNWAIIMGEETTGATFFYLEEDADSGDIIAQKSIPITFQDNCRTVYAKATTAYIEMLCENLPLLEKGKAPRTHNVSRSFPCYPGRKPEDGLIDFQRPAIDVYNWIRALTHPYPGAFFYQDGKKILVWEARIGEPEDPSQLTMSTLDGQITFVDYEVCE